MSSQENEDRFSSISIFYDNEYVEIIDLTPLGKDKFSGFVRNEETQKFIQKDISSDLVRIPSISSISVCENISKYTFTLLFFALNTTREYMVGNAPQRLFTSICVKNGQNSGLANSPEADGSEILVNEVINKIKRNEVDWGVVSYFGVEEVNGREVIFIELIHRDFANIFVIPVIYHPNERTYMEVKTGETELFLSGNAID